MLLQGKFYGGYASLAELTRRCGYPNSLGQSDEGAHVPPASLRKVAELYEQDKIPYGSLKYFTGLLGASPEALGFGPEETERQLSRKGAKIAKGNENG